MSAAWAGMNEETMDAETEADGPVPTPRTEAASRSVSLAETAYDRIEELIVHFTLRPGADVKTQTVQEMIGLGRTPTHQAIRRFAAETLIIIRPRDGLQISPIDLMRDRRLLRLRRDMDRFVVELAAERLSGNHRNQLLHLAQRLRDRRDAMDAVEFNGYDRALDEADKKAGKKITCPVQVLWGAKAALAAWYDTLAIWREWADDVQGQAVDCGHFIPEEKPAETLALLRGFFG